MKFQKITYLAAVGILATTLGAFGQGSVIFASGSNPNTTADLIFNSNTGANEMPGTTVVIALYAAAPTEMNRDNITTQLGATTVISMGAPGEFSGGTRPVDLGGGLPNAGAPQAAFVVRAWDSTYGNDWATFLMTAPATATRGESDVFVQDAGVFGTINLPGPLNGFGGVVLVPEPSTYALGALGLGALAVWRRRTAKA